MAQAFSFMGQQQKPQNQSLVYNPSKPSTTTGFRDSQPTGGTSQPPNTGSSGNQWNLPTWDNSTPSRFNAGVANPGQPLTEGGTWWGNQIPGGFSGMFDPGKYSEPNTPYSRALENSLPWAQFMQNTSQYKNDFNEAQRRWDTEQGWGQTVDQFGMGLQTRQQQSAEEQARLAADQWNRQFGWTQTTDQWGRELSQQELDQRNAYQMGQITNEATANQNTRDYQTGLLGNEAQANKNTAAYQSGLLGNQAREITNTAQYQAGLLGNEAQANRNTAAYQTGLLGNQAKEIANTGQYQTGLINVQTQANQIEQAYRQGLISNEQYANATNRLMQAAQQQYWQGSLTEQQRASQAAEMLRQQEINQQLQLAAMQAYGRSQAPNARWQRNWG